MKNKFAYFFILLFLNIFLLQLVSIQAKESSQSNNDSPEFREIAIRTKKFLKKIDLLKVETKKQKNGKIIIVTEKITKYILEHRNEFDTLKDNLNNFIIKFPNSEWVDDAKILLGCAYLTVNLRELPFSEEAINIYTNIIGMDKRLNINFWTRHLLSDLTVSSIFKPLPGEDWMINLDENDILKVNFSRALVVEYLKKGDFSQAETIVVNFKNRSDIIGTSQNIESLNRSISSWKNKME